MKRIPALLSFSLAALLLASARVDAATLTDRYVFANDVTDSVGANNGAATPNGTTNPTETPTYVTDSPTGATGITTAISLGMTSGKTSGFSIPNSAFDKNAGSLVFWVKPQQTSGGGADYLINLPGGNNGLLLYFSADSLNLRASVENSSTAAVATLTASTWAQLAVTWDASTSTGLVYVNGVLALTENFATPGSTLTSSASPRIGNYDLGGGFPTDQYVGDLYDFQVYSGALSASEVSSLYTNPGLSLAQIAVPEPSTWAFLFLGTAFLAWTGRATARRTASQRAD